jgi:hypothetical protein
MHYFVRFEVLSVINMKIIVFWDVLSCNLVDGANLEEKTRC